VQFETKTFVTADPLNVAYLYVCSILNPTCSATPYATRINTRTDAQGRARVQVLMGRVPGNVTARITVPALDLVDSASYTITVGAVGGVRVAAADTALDIGERAVLRGRVIDRVGNTRPEVASLSRGPGSSVTLDSATATVTAAGFGAQQLFVRYRGYVDSMVVRVVPQGTLIAWSQPSLSVRQTSINGRGVPRTLDARVLSDFGVFPRLSVDRQRVSYHRSNGVDGGPSTTVMVQDTSGLAQRTYSLEGQLANVHATRVMLDRSLILVCEFKPQPNFPGLSAIRVAVDGTITFIAAIPETANTPLGGVDISPDGRRVVYVASSAEGPRGVQVLDLQTKALTVLVTSGDAPRWSPTGDRIAFLSRDPFPFDPVPPYSLYVMGFSGQLPSRLSTRTFDAGFAWSPDGAYIAGRAKGAIYITRVGDGAQVALRLRTPAGELEDYSQLDWQ
jgi:hypothetical protein